MRNLVGKCCRDCTERYLGCHDHCEKRRKAIEEDAKNWEIEQKGRRLETDLYGYYKSDKERRRRR